jgi:uncharacterized protein involved in outer membrane biogenesis
MNPQDANSRPRRLKRFAVGFAIFVLLFGVFGFLAGPPIARALLVDLLTKQLHRPASVGDISINPYTLSAEVHDLKIGNATGGETAGFDLLFVNLDSASLFRGGPVIEELRLAGPRIRLVREAAGKYDISDLLEEWLKPSDSPTPRFSVNNIQISGGRIDFDDKPTARQHTVAELNLSLPFISNLAYQTQIFVEPAFSATINGAPLALGGRSRPFAEMHESELKLDLKHLDLTHYVGYSPLPLPFSLAGGLLDSDLSLVFRDGPQQQATLSIAGQVTLHDLQLAETVGEPLLGIKELSLPIVGVDPLRGQFGLGSLRIDGLEGYLRVDRDGTLNWLAIAGRLRGDKPAEAAPAKASEPLAWSVEGLQLSNANLHWQDDSAPPRLTATVADIDVKAGKLDSQFSTPLSLDATWSVDASPHARVERVQISSAQVDLKQRRIGVAEIGIRGLQAALVREADGSLAGLHPPSLRSQAGPAAGKAKDSADEPSWIAEITKAELSDFGLRLEDRTVSPKTIQVIDAGRFSLENFSTAPKTTAKLSLAARINKKGHFQATGSVQSAPLATRLKLELRGIEILPIQPYFADKVNVTVTRGQVSGKGELSLAMDDGGPLTGGYRGEVTVGNVHSVDKANSEDFLNWKSFHLGDIDLRLSPIQLAIGDIALADFFARVIVSADGKLNLMQIVRKDEPATADTGTATTPPATVAQAGAQPATPPPPIRIDRVTLQAGTVSITDHFIKPNYSAELAEIGGRITGLSSAADTSADVDLRGSYDGAPVSIAGKLNPLAAKPTLDIKAEVRGVEMTPLSPYAGKYAGYAIDKGKLSLFLSYKVDQGKLTADNRIFLDQLTFGQKVESPDALKLPVTLAVSLLQNRRGEIDINLPISGSLDDPQFSVGGIIFQVIMNLLSKAITAPFALLGSLFGGGEELSQVEFDNGRATLTTTAVKRLETLAKALDDRPGLKLEIVGRVDPEQDPEGLRRVALERKIKAQKLAQTVSKGTEAGSADEVSVEEKEYAALLEEAYKKEKFPKPRNWVGLAKSLPREEMEKLMLANMPAGADELRELAQQRAHAVADWLAGPGKVERARIFLLPPKLAADGTGTKEAKLARAEFSLK